jgi:predicted adenine nucleotide alpha hydrolase (AANH) superfamily ATPase
LERLAADFRMTIFYYNPNIDTPLEFMRRAEELEKLRKLGVDFDVMVADYQPAEYDAAVMGLENLGEGSARCYECYKLRLSRTAQQAARDGFDYFATTLSVSPHKKSDWISAIGSELEQQYGVKYLDENFKKQDGYKRSLELSRDLKLYRQDYCGCKYSRTEAKTRRTATNRANYNVHRP